MFLKQRDNLTFICLIHFNFVAPWSQAGRGLPSLDTKLRFHCGSTTKPALARALFHSEFLSVIEGAAHTKQDILVQLIAAWLQELQSLGTQAVLVVLILYPASPLVLTCFFIPLCREHQRLLTKGTLSKLSPSCAVTGTGNFAADFLGVEAGPRALIPQWQHYSCCLQKKLGVGNPSSSGVGVSVKGWSFIWPILCGQIPLLLITLCPIKAKKNVTAFLLLSGAFSDLGSVLVCVFWTCFFLHEGARGKFWCKRSDFDLVQ